jgi:hypothetical protein
MSEIRHGCDVYPYVVEKAQPLDVSRFNVPDWAQWVAADSDGFVFPYEERPSVSRDCWSNTGDRQVTCIGTISMDGIDWRRTLTAVNVEPQPQPWCEQCNLPEDICRGHDDATRRRVVRTGSSMNCWR